MRGYLQRVSVPPFGHIEIHVEAPLMEYGELTSQAAHLAEAEEMGEDHLLEAIQYSCLDRSVWR